MEQSKPHWWPENDDSDEGENEEEAAAEQIEGEVDVEKGGEDQEVGG